MKDKLYIIIPAYNEADNIGEVIQEWYPIVKKIGGGSKLVVIDDGSKDKTYSIVKQYSEQYPQLVALQKENGGHGSAVLYGYYYAIKNEASYVFQTDSDRQTCPEEFGQFWNIRDQYDGIFGNRTTRKDGKFRIITEKILCLLIRIFFGVKIPDANAPYRLMQGKILEKYIYRIPKNYNLPNVMLTVFFVYYKEKVQFTQITFVPRQAGEQSINMLRIFQIGRKTLHDFYNFRKEM